MTHSQIIIAFDFDDRKPADHLLDQLNPDQATIKIGKSMFTRFGPDYVREVINKGFPVFLDLKFHDIPNTVAGACKAAADLGVWMLNVHSLGGHKMMTAAVEALASYGQDKPLLIGVTLLTSLSNSDLDEVGIIGPTEQRVVKLAANAKQAGLDGVVCSAQEAVAIRESVGLDFCLVTPGIRLQDSADDQQRVMTPASAIEAGSDYLVIGRPITQAPDPALVLEQIRGDLSL